MRADRPHPSQSDPVGALLDFLLMLRRFVAAFGERRPPEGLDSELTRTMGPSRALEGLRARKALRRRGLNPGPRR